MDTFVIEPLACCQALRPMHLHRASPLSAVNRLRGTLGKRKERKNLRKRGREREEGVEIHPVLALVCDIDFKHVCLCLMNFDG